MQLNGAITLKTETSIFLLKDQVWVLFSWEKASFYRISRMKITTTNADFSLQVLGKGDKNILAFHGVGQDSKVFETIVCNHPEYTIYAIDLPFHGNTDVYKPENRISQSEVIKLAQKIIDHFEIQKFILLGYSIGAKMALPLIEPFYPQIHAVWLLAPDGIRPNFWYRIGTGSSAGRFILRQILLHPHALKLLGKALKSMRLIDKNTLRLASGTTATVEKSRQVYQIWTYLCHLKTNLVAVANTVNSLNIPLHLILGDEDRLITRRNVLPLVEKAPKAKITILHSRHQHLIEKFAECGLEKFS